MGERESARTDRAQADLQVLLEEVWALALDGSLEAPLRLLEDLPGDRVEPSSTPAIDLLKARLLLRQDSPEGRIEATRSLRYLSERTSPSAWRARLELARILRRDGKSTEAAAVLKHAVEEFRGSPAASGPYAEGLALILTAEAERIHHDAMGQGPALDDERPDLRDQQQPGTHRRPAATHPQLDASLLLRLVDLGRRLAAETDTERVLRVILHEAIDLAGAERGFLVLTGGDRLDFALAENVDWSEIEKPSFEVSRTLIREVGATGRSAFLSLADLPAGDPMTDSLTSRGVHAVACIPMIGPAGTSGVLYIDRRHASGGFSTSLRWLLDLFAGQAGSALENARAHVQKTRELEVARELVRRHQSAAERRTRYDTLIGASDAMQEVFRRLDLMVPTEMPIVILGETGTGKELVAHVIHERGPRRGGAFVAINCAGLPETLLESELFGHEKGAYSGADRARPGLFEVAHDGTLFLDEVGDMSPRMQGELLRALQSGEVRRLGSREPVFVNVRVIAATHRDLEEKTGLGEFREDLYYRLNVLTLRLPPLRERPEDVALLASEILASLAQGGTPQTISPQAMRLLAAYSWPGNVRQLENVLRRLSVLGTLTVEPAHLPDEIRLCGNKPSPPGTLRQAEADAIDRALEAAAGNKAEAARILGVDRKTLHLKMKRRAGA
jgi:transcriptional regulator with GAF, ATPase, and Fis domain